MDGSCLSRRPNQEESEPIRDSAPCPSLDGGGGPPGPRTAMLARPSARLGRSLPAPLRAHCDADVRAFKLWSRRAGPGTRGQPQMPMNAMVAITRTAQAAAPSLSHGTQGSRRAGVSVGSGVSQLGLVLSISPVTVLSLSSQCDLSSRED